MNKSIALLSMVFLLAACSRPLARFSYTEEKQKAPTKVIFENESQKADTYQWDFGDGSRSSEFSPSHVYKSSGNYTIRLTAEKGKKTTTVEKTIQIKAPDVCLVEIETEYGNMLVQLYDATPQHRDNFLKLAEEGFYDGIIFHRIIEGFMIQGGDPESKKANAAQSLGSGGPGYTIPAEFVDSLAHIKGALAAARTGDQVNPEKRSSGSQFYIVQGKPVKEEELAYIESRKGFRYAKSLRDAYAEKGGTPFLDRDYTVFGQVIEGLDVIDKIAAVKTDQRDRPVKDVKMKISVIK